MVGALRIVIFVAGTVYFAISEAEVVRIPISVADAVRTAIF